MTRPAPSREAAANAVAAMPGLAGARVVRPLAAGPTNTTWLVEHGAQQWVLRLDTPAATDLGLNRETERQACAVAAAAGITPEYRLFDPAAGICLRRYVPGRAWTAEDLHDTRSLERLAAVLRRLHALPVVGEPFDPGAAVRRYAGQVGSRAAATLGERALAALEAAWGGAGRVALCHNDLVAENVLETLGEGLVVIDWEYAGAGDPWFDLAVVIRHHGLGERLARMFLEAYLQRPATGEEYDQLLRLCTFYGCLLQLWERLWERL
jgi:aminoglycoside phosphotransferase (APT) family kinase protein